MPEALVFGATGQIGEPLLHRLLAAGWQVTAVSRHAHPEMPGVSWRRGGFDDLPELPSRAEAIFSCGPLDHFARWFATSSIETPRVIAFGSTSVEVKQASADPHERDLADRLRDGEACVLATAAARGAAATLLRPTLVYGAGRDATLTRIAALARRWGRFPLPRNAHGLRQPVHVDDLAAAAHACVGSEATAGQTYALPGGETLRYRDMIARVLDTLEPSPRLLELPSPLFNLALTAARIGGRANGLGDAAVKRMRSDLVFDIAPAQRDFGYLPRVFRPTAGMFDARRAPA